jgi:hypothetical protein
VIQDFLDPGYLRHGNPRQRAAYAALDELNIFDWLAIYRPVLAGTIPLAIDIAGSDLDVLCEVYDFDRFAGALASEYGENPGFTMRAIDGTYGPVAFESSFRHSDFVVEFFGEPLPVSEQRGYRHMTVEARLLDIGGEPLRQTIIALKQSGLKTEPAFAHHLGLAGDPYEAVLKLETRTDDDLRKLIDDLAEAHGG